MSAQSIEGVRKDASRKRDAQDAIEFEKEDRLSDIDRRTSSTKRVDENLHGRRGNALWERAGACFSPGTSLKWLTFPRGRERMAKETTYEDV